MKAFEWRAQFEAPRLVHDRSGLVSVAIGERVIVFPSEAAARFFHAACTDLPNLAAENAELRRWLDEGALHAAEARANAAERENTALKREMVELRQQLAEVASDQAAARRRAKVLATALKKVAP